MPHNIYNIIRVYYSHREYFYIFLYFFLVDPDDHPSQPYTMVNQIRDIHHCFTWYFPDAYKIPRVIIRNAFIFFLVNLRKYKSISDVHSKDVIYVRETLFEVLVYIPDLIHCDV